jgi:hypothetical protein
MAFSLKHNCGVDCGTLPLGYSPGTSRLLCHQLRQEGYDQKLWIEKKEHILR